MSGTGLCNWIAFAQLTPILACSNERPAPSLHQYGNIGGFNEDGGAARGKGLESVQPLSSVSVTHPLSRARSVGLEALPSASLTHMLAFLSFQI